MTISLVKASLGSVVVSPSFKAKPDRAHEGLVQMQFLQHQPRQRPDQRLAQAAQFAADDDQPRPAPGQFVGGVQRIGHHRQVASARSSRRASSRTVLPPSR